MAPAPAESALGGGGRLQRKVLARRRARVRHGGAWPWEGGRTTSRWAGEPDGPAERKGSCARPKTLAGSTPGGCASARTATDWPAAPGDARARARHSVPVPFSVKTVADTRLAVTKRWDAEHTLPSGAVSQLDVPLNLSWYSKLLTRIVSGSTSCAAGVCGKPQSSSAATSTAHACAMAAPGRIGLDCLLPTECIRVFMCTKPGGGQESLAGGGNRVCSATESSVNSSAWPWPTAWGVGGWFRARLLPGARRGPLYLQHQQRSCPRVIDPCALRLSTLWNATKMHACAGKDRPGVAHVHTRALCSVAVAVAAATCAEIAPKCAFSH